MLQVLLTAGVGLAVGILVGLTGIGGRALLVSILVIFMRVPPLVAVETGAFFVAVTKLGAAWSYRRRGHVEMQLVGRMALGSVPGAMIGVRVLALLRAHLGNSVNELQRFMIRSLLVATPALAFLKSRLERSGRRSLRDRLPPYITASNGAVLVGLVGGLLVGMASVGSGSIIRAPLSRHGQFSIAGCASAWVYSRCVDSCALGDLCSHHMAAKSALLYARAAGLSMF